MAAADRDAVWSPPQIIVSRWQHRPLALWSGALPSSSDNYTSFERQLLTCCRALRVIKHLAMGHQVTVLLPRPAWLSVDVLDEGQAEDEEKHKDIIQKKLGPGGTPHSDGHTVTPTQAQRVYYIQLRLRRGWESSQSLKLAGNSNLPKAGLYPDICAKLQAAMCSLFASLPLADCDSDNRGLADAFHHRACLRFGHESGSDPALSSTGAAHRQLGSYLTHRARKLGLHNCTSSSSARGIQ